MDAEVTRYAIQVPHLGSLILTNSWDGEIRGLKTFPREDRPYSPIVFWTFRAMAGLGFLMLFAVLLGWWLGRGARLYESRAFQRFMLWMGPSGIVALLAGGGGGGPPNRLPPPPVAGRRAGARRRSVARPARPHQSVPG
ncbi:MAG: hypothetical protein GAK41_01326 [Burkholderia gladioli]|nr:MAG: hypothetical protein GAK41_01326 [Burkholderia gladioli]